jgi:hypothetical protein
MKQEIYRHYPGGHMVARVEGLLDRGVLADASRSITRNRQPGKCCAKGCALPGTPIMEALPGPGSATTKRAITAVERSAKVSPLRPKSDGRRNKTKGKTR